MKRIVFILFLVLGTVGCKSRQVETIIDTHKESSVEVVNGTTESRDSSSIELNVSVGEVNDIVEENTKITYFEDGVISKIEEHSKKIDKSHVNTQASFKEDEVSAVAIDTTRINVEDKVNIQEETKAESKPSTPFVISYWILYLLILVVVYGLVRYRKQIFKL